MNWIENLHWSVAIMLFWAIGIVRTSVVFALGWAAHSGGSRFARIRALLANPVYKRAQEFVHRWGALAVVLCFVTVGFQTAVIMTTGVSRMPLRRWIPAMLIGTLIWGIIYGTIGMAVFWAWVQRPFIVLGAALLLACVSLFMKQRGAKER